MAEFDDLFRLNQYAGPESLTELCLKLICENLDIISVKRKNGSRKLRKGLALPSEICDSIIDYVLRNDTLKDDDHNDFFTIFKDLSSTKLKYVKVTRCNMTDQSLKILCSHKLVDLELTDCSRLTTYTIEYINSYSENLRSLICHGTMILPWKLSEYQERRYVFKTPNLRRLALEYLQIYEDQYSILLGRLTNLTHLDLSNSFYASGFTFYKSVPNLVSLTLYNVRVNEHPMILACNICSLKNLRHLDISQSDTRFGIFDEPTLILSIIVTGLPNLTSLDIGGTNLANAQESELPSGCKIDYSKKVHCDIPGLIPRYDKPLQFLGLYGSPDGACRRRNIPAKMIAGDASEDQLLITARVCMNHKPELLQRVLSDLYHVFRYESCRRMDQALCTVLEAMEKHPYQKHIQISGSATLFYILKMKEKGVLEVRMKKRIVSSLLIGMNIYKNEEIMMRNGCLALSQLRIPQDVMSHYETLVKVLLHSAKRAEPEGFVERVGIYLLNTLACQVEGREKRLLGTLGCVRTMLELIAHRVESGIFDDVLEVAWSIMWNMTDETPANCQRFLDENGMALFLECVRHYPHKELLRNMMGLFGNVAEVKHLRVHLMQQQYMSVFANFLRSNTDSIEVSYNAAGILAHMTSDGVEAWTVSEPTRTEVLASMSEAIERWDLYTQRNINYRSFVPLLRLLDVYHTSECQYWAVWALANLTNVCSSRYCALVEKEGGLEKLESLILDPRPHRGIKDLAKLVIENCNHYNNTEVWMAKK